jgi:hypothetical protein
MNGEEKEFNLDPGAEPKTSKLSQAEIEKLITDNIGLAYYIADKWASTMASKVSREDVQGNALHALVVAANNYDPSKGKFSTFAGQKIKWFLGHQNFHHHKKISGEQSIDAPLGGEEGDEDSSMHDKLGDAGAMDVQHSAEQSEAAQIVQDEIDKLPEPERTMFIRWNNGESYRDMQSDFGLSFTMIGIKVVAAREKVKAGLIARGIVSVKDILPESEFDGEYDGKMFRECLNSIVTSGIAMKALQEEQTRLKLTTI